MAASARPGRVLMKAAASLLVIALPRERQTATRRSTTSQTAARPRRAVERVTDQSPRVIVQPSLASARPCSLAVRVSAFPGPPPMRQALQRAHSPTALPGSSKGPDAG